MIGAQSATSRPAISLRRGSWLFLILLIILINAIPYRQLVNIDDAYITYRYAENLLHHREMVYNLQGDKAFAATAPGYVVVLAGLGALGLSIDFAGYLLAVLAILLAAWALMDLMSCWPLATGIGAAVLLALLPLPWLVIGMEPVLVMALALLAFAFTVRGRHLVAAALLLFATALRFDAATAAAAWGVWLLVTAGRRALAPILLYGFGTVAVYAALRIFLDVPLPTTLASKQAQVALGVTGFGPHTTYLSGFGLLAQAHVEQSLAYWLVLALAVLGVVAAAVLGVRLAGNRGTSASSSLPGSSAQLLAPILLLALWAASHLVAYLLLGVTPYLWYYLAFFPLLAALVAIGITVTARALGSIGPLARSPRAVPALAAVLWVVVLLGPVASHLAIRASQPELGGGKVAIGNDLLLPGTHWGPYRTIGEWLTAETPSDASAGMMEIGIVGYYSRRPVVDFLGLLDTDIASALTRGDISWALRAQQPDYVVLGKGYPMYSYNVYQDRWFQAAYEPRHQVMNRVPGGNWFTIYGRKGERLPHGPVQAVPATAEPLSIRFGDEFELVAFDAAPDPWQPEQPAWVTFYWRALKAPSKDYTLFVHLRDGRGMMIAGGDGQPMLGEMPSSRWQPGQLLADFHPLGLPPMPLAPTDLVFEIGFYDEGGARLPAFRPDGSEMVGGQATFGSRRLLPAAEPLRFGSGEPGNIADLAVASYSLSAPSLTRGTETKLSVEVSEARVPAVLTAELWDWPGGRVIWSQDLPVAARGSYVFRIAASEGEPASEGELRVRVRRDDLAVSWLDKAGHAINDFAPLTQLAIQSP